MKKGDVHFEIGDATLFIFERKTIRDLCSAVQTNRHQEQRDRLLNSKFPTNQILYLFEWEPHLYTVADVAAGKIEHLFDLQTIQTIMTNMVHKYSFQVFLDLSWSFTCFFGFCFSFWLLLT